MKGTAALLACLACLAGGARMAAASEPVDLTYAGGRLTIHCTQTPLVDLLEQIQDATGIELYLEEAVGHTRVSVEIEKQPLDLAMESLLEGSGIAYAMTLKPEGDGVARMYIGSEAKAKPLVGSSTLASSRPASMPRLPVRPVPDRTPPAAAAKTPPPAPAATAADEEEDEDTDADLDDDPEVLAAIKEEKAATPDGKPVAPAPPGPVILENPAPVPPDNPLER